MNQEQLVYRYVSCTVLLTFLTEAVNFDRDGVSRKRKQHLTPFQQNTFGIVRTLSNNPCSTVRTLQKLLLKILFVMGLSSLHEDRVLLKLLCFFFISFKSPLL